MMDNENRMPRSSGLRPYLAVLVLIWTAGVLASLGWNIYELQRSILSVAHEGARVAYSKDLVYRRWAAVQGGVYVPVSETTPGNPYLTVPDRDVRTSGGRALTLVNPAYMTRQVNEIAMEIYEFRGHITSLNLMRPENRPDPWETEALRKFEQGVKEAGSIQWMAGTEYYRLMYPLKTEKACLKCHAAQGYREGDIRGGLSVSIPMEPLRTIERSRRSELIFAHGFLWVIGLAGITISTRQLRNQILRREKLEGDLLVLSITDELTSLHNRRGFLSLAEQQLKISDRTGRRVILFFADLDGMKQINDTLGHEMGDKALVEVASILKKTFRTSDIVARMGGDEFVVLAIDPETADPEMLVNRMQNQVDAYNSRENRQYRLSISVGYAAYDPDHPLSLDEIMTKADERMYEQKKGKKSRNG
jgi:diguanylate cyclase (GGDEF)-like protein